MRSQANLLEIFYELDKMRVLPVTDEELNAATGVLHGNFSCCKLLAKSSFGLRWPYPSTYLHHYGFFFFI
jgi:hypothetical protein